MIDDALDQRCRWVTTRKRHLGANHAHQLLSQHHHRCTIFWDTYTRPTRTHTHTHALSKNSFVQTRNETVRTCWVSQIQNNSNSRSWGTVAAQQQPPVRSTAATNTQHGQHPKRTNKLLDRRSSSSRRSRLLHARYSSSHCMQSVCRHVPQYPEINRPDLPVPVIKERNLYCAVCPCGLSDDGLILLTITNSDLDAARMSEEYL
jgi:hypothetical protein